MLRAAFIISLWPALLSAAGLGGQLYYSFSASQAPKAVVSDAALRAAGSGLSMAALVVFFLPILVSLLLWVAYALKRKALDSMVIATLSLNVFSLLYGLVLYGAFR